MDVEQHVISKQVDIGHAELSFVTLVHVNANNYIVGKVLLIPLGSVCLEGGKVQENKDKCESNFLFMFLEKSM